MVKSYIKIQMLTVSRFEDIRGDQLEGEIDSCSVADEWRLADDPLEEASWFALVQTGEYFGVRNVVAEHDGRRMASYLGYVEPVDKKTN